LQAINATSVPREIKDLIGKILLFKVEIKKLNNSQFQSSYAVKRISDDELIIEKFLKLSALKIVSLMLSNSRIMKKQNYVALQIPRQQPK